MDFFLVGLEHGLEHKRRKNMEKSMEPQVVCLFWVAGFILPTFQTGMMTPARTFKTYFKRLG